MTELHEAYRKACLEHAKRFDEMVRDFMRVNNLTFDDLGGMIARGEIFYTEEFSGTTFKTTIHFPSGYKAP